jgi:hypothetical protein
MPDYDKKRHLELFCYVYERLNSSWHRRDDLLLGTARPAGMQVLIFACVLATGLIGAAGNT